MAFYTLQMIVIAVTLPWFTSAQIDGFRLVDGDPDETYGVLVLQDGTMDLGLVCYSDSSSINDQFASLVCKELGFTFPDERSQGIPFGSIQDPRESSLLQLNIYSLTCNSAVCPSGMTLVAGSCYKFFSTETFPLAAQTSCSAYGGLARITSADISALDANFNFDGQWIWVINGNNAPPSSDSASDRCDALDSGDNTLITLACDQGKGYLCGFTPGSQWFDECQFQPLQEDCVSSVYFGVLCSGPVDTSCANRCTTGVKPRWVCQCNSECVRYGDCCSDFLEQCTYPSIQGNDGNIAVDGDGATINEGIVVILEKTTNQVVGYVCHNGRWLTNEAAAVCRELGFQQEAEQKYIELPVTPSRTIIGSYMVCLSGEETLADCTFSSSSNMTTTCPAIAGVACNVASTTPSTSTEHDSSKTNDGVDISTQATNTEGNEGGTVNSSTSPSVSIIIVVVVVITILIIAVLLLVCYRKGKAKALGSAPPSNGKTTVDMATIATYQSVDPVVPHEYLTIGELKCVNQPGVPQTAPVTSHDHEYLTIDEMEYVNEPGVLQTASGSGDGDTSNYDYASIDYPADPAQQSTGHYMNHSRMRNPRSV